MSQYKKEKPKIVDHRHCVVCGRAVPPSAEFCSPDCREKFMAAKAKEKRSKIMLIVVYVLMMVVLVFFFLARPMA